MAGSRPDKATGGLGRFGWITAGSRPDQGRVTWSVFKTDMDKDKAGFQGRINLITSGFQGRMKPLINSDFQGRMELIMSVHLDLQEMDHELVQTAKQRLLGRKALSDADELVQSHGPINKIERTRKEAETLVFWDINNCPVPKECDAGLLGSCIESALKKAGHCKGFTDAIDDLLTCNPESLLTTVLVISGAMHVEGFTYENSFFWETLVEGVYGLEERIRQRLEEKLRFLTKIGETETLVFWDIDTCMVPKDCDARMVGLGIESALKKAGVSGGPLTITAIGNLKYTSQVNPDVLPAIFSTGIHALEKQEGMHIMRSTLNLPGFAHYVELVSYPELSLVKYPESIDTKLFSEIKAIEEGKAKEGKGKGKEDEDEAKPKENENEEHDDDRR
ncbi:hypothetical protein Bca101_025867 [Brassica carinata]